MKSILWGLAVIAAIGLAAFAGYSEGHKKGFDEGERSQSSEISKLKTAQEEMNKQNYQLRAENMLWQEEYDELYDTANAFVGVPRYTPQTTFNCSTYSYGMSGNYSSTTCY